MIKYLLSFFLLFTSSVLFGQKSDKLPLSSKTITTFDFSCGDCVMVYDKGDPISLKGVIPNITPVKLPAGGSILFADRFIDADRVKFKSGNCPSGTPLNTWFPAECSGYLIRYEIVQNPDFGSFQLGVDEDQIEVGYFSIGLIPIPGIPVPFNLWESDAVKLYTDAMWAPGNNIKVTVDIADTAPLPPNDSPGFIRTGSCQDDELTNHHTWTFIYDDDIPGALEQNNNNPPEDEWTDMFDVVSSSYTIVEYKYKGIETCPVPGNNSYESHVVTESFTNESVLFGWDDLLSDWVTANNITSIQQAIDKLFPLGLHGSAASFILNGNSEFSDFHSLGYDLNENPTIVFTTAALLGNKVGYNVGQEYFNAQTISLGTTLIQRQLRQVPGELPGTIDWYIKKDHMLCN